LSSVARLALTSGEPAGIGPDLCVALAQQQQASDIVVIADPELISERARQLGMPVTLVKADLSKPASIAKQGCLHYLPVSLASPVEAGVLNKNNSQYVLDTLQLALEACLDGRFDAVVTAPVHKGVINEANVVFTGHTEFFAEGADVDKVVMMLATQDLRVALATTHLPLSQVSPAITQHSLSQVITIVNSSLQEQFGIKKPKIAVCGLNPHAGEGGHLGTEEIDVILPVIDRFSQQGLFISGPWPADTVFVQEKLSDFDVVLAMYHDQGLPVLKHKGFGKAVNITLGLPFIRTSVDHGTALEIAGTGKAKMTSLQAAIDMANTMIMSRRNK